MSKIADTEANATSLDGLVNDNALVPTLRNGPKPSYQYLVDGWTTEFDALIDNFEAQGDNAITSINADVVTVEAAKNSAISGIDSDLGEFDAYYQSAKDTIGNDVSEFTIDSDAALAAFELSSSNSLSEFAQESAEAFNEFDLTLEQYKESRGFNTKGTFANGFTYELPNDVGLDADGNPWIYNGTLPFTVAAGITPTSPTYTQVIYGTASQVSTNTSDTVQSFVDSFTLKIFQSPTDGGFTEIQTRTVDASDVYEVRKASDDSLATIYSDAAGANEIPQNGTDNKSGSDGVVEFYIADGDYYLEVGGVESSFSCGAFLSWLGDSQLASGNIWPINPKVAASAGQLGLVDISYLRGFNGELYALAVGNSFVTSSGDITSVDFANLSAVIGGTSYNLYTIKQKDGILSHEIKLSDWGVLPDGVTDNSDALMAIREVMLREPEVNWGVIGNGGVVAYTNNKWLVDVKNMSFNGKGCELRNINETALTSNESRPLFIQRIFEGDVFNSTFDVHDGFLIDDANAGDGSVFTSSSSDAGKISAGEWAMIYGYDQQQFGGYLPNARFFDWVFVNSVNSSTGEVEFSGGNRIRNSYYNSWADGEAGGVDIGKPRIISTVRTTAQGYNSNRVFPANISFKDVKFGSVSSLGASWGHSSVFLDMKDFTVKHEGTFYTALGSKECVYENIKFDQPSQKPLTDFAIEQDKLTELCVVKNTLPAHGVAGGTGVDNLVFDNMTFPKDCRIRVGAKHVTFNQSSLLGCRAVSQPEYMLQYSDSPVESLRFNDCRLVMNDDQLAISRESGSSNTIASGDWSSLGGRQISILGDAVAGEYSSRLSIGSALIIGDSLTNGNADYGVVENIQSSGNDTIITLRGSIGDTFDSAQDITFYNSNAPSFNEGCSIKRRDGSIVNQPLSAVTPSFLYGGRGDVTLKYSSFQMSSFTLGAMPYPCFIKEVRVNVVRAYAGTDSTFVVELSRIEQSSQYIRVSLKDAGVRRFNSFESVNEKAGDTNNANLFETPNLQGIRLFIRSDSGGALPSDVYNSGNSPIYHVEVDLAPLTA